MLKGRRILLAGVTSVVGAAVLRLLSSQGANVAFAGRDDFNGMHLSDASSSYLVSTDYGQQDPWTSAVAKALAELGGIDGLVIATGSSLALRLSQTSDQDWDAMIGENLVAPFLITRACLAALGESRGAVVYIGSGVAEWPELELGAYSVAMRSLTWMSRMFAVEGAMHGVRVNCVQHGELGHPVTEMLRQPPLHAAATPLPPMGRKTTPGDIASAVAYLLSDEAGQCCGSTVLIDGGLRAALRANKVRQ